MKLKAIICQVFTREAAIAVSRSPHQVDFEVLPIGLHQDCNAMRPKLQEQIDAADAEGYDAIVLGYALCGRGTDGLRAGKTPLVMPRAHDCIDILMGGHSKSMASFETQPGVYYCTPGWVEFLESSSGLQPASSINIFGDPRPLTELIAKYGEAHGRYLYENFGASGGQESKLTFISTGVPGEDQLRHEARDRAEAEHKEFAECQGTIEVLRASLRRSLGHRGVSHRSSRLQRTRGARRPRRRSLLMAGAGPTGFVLRA